MVLCYIILYELQQYIMSCHTIMLLCYVLLPYLVLSFIIQVMEHLEGGEVRRPYTKG